MSDRTGYTRSLKSTNRNLKILEMFEWLFLRAIGVSKNRYNSLVVMIYVWSCTRSLKSVTRDLTIYALFEWLCLRTDMFSPVRFSCLSPLNSRTWLWYENCTHLDLISLAQNQPWVEIDHVVTLVALTEQLIVPAPQHCHLQVWILWAILIYPFLVQSHLMVLLYH